MSPSTHSPNSHNNLPSQTNTQPVMPASRSNLGTNNMPNNLKKPSPPSFDKQETLNNQSLRQTATPSGSSPAVNNNAPLPMNSSRSKEGISDRRLPQRPPTSEEQEDTMNNLRKTFAGIFGDM